MMMSNISFVLYDDQYKLCMHKVSPELTLNHKAFYSCETRSESQPLVTDAVLLPLGKESTISIERE